MQPKHHALIGIATVPFLWPAVGPAATFVFLSASVVLIDLDHALDFLIHTRFSSFSIRKMFLYHRYLFQRIKRSDFLSLEPFHTVEFLALLVWLSVWSGSPLLQAATGGMLLHFICDLLYLRKIGAFSARAHSMVEYLVRKRRMIRNGIPLEKPFQEAAQLCLGPTQGDPTGSC